MKLPKAKIEERAINTLNNIIDGHPTMQSDFWHMDKEMCWDGYIWIYSGEIEQSKATYDDKVSVQIKGHIDKKEKYLSKDRITYPVNLADLKVYFKNTGVLYFVIFMSEDTRKRVVYYTSLFPSKIKAYLESAEKKKNTKSISIPFAKLKKTPEDFYVVVKQFSIESRKQGFGVGPVVRNTITDKDVDKVDTITMLAVGACNEQEFLEKLEAGDVCMYGVTKDSLIERPLEWKEDEVKVYKQEVDEAVGIKRTVYYI